MKEIPVGRHHFALVDDCDYDRLAAHKWHLVVASDRMYAYRQDYSSGVRRTVGMHSEVIPVMRGFDVDHIDRNGLNNTRGNLRRCTRSQNNANRRRQSNATSKRFKGIYPHCQYPNRWCAQIGFNGKRKYLGIYDSEEEAARAYDAAAVEVYGEFARTNFDSRHA